MNAKDIALIKALGGGGSGGSGGSITVDSELSDTSTNPVQNKVIKSALDALGGGLIVNLTKDETNIEFTSSKRAYTADKTADEVNAALFSGRTVYLKANYIDASGVELMGFYHYAGFYNGAFAFINVEAAPEVMLAGRQPVVGYDTIIRNQAGFWSGAYTDLQNSSVTQTS